MPGCPPPPVLPASAVRAGPALPIHEDPVLPRRPPAQHPRERRIGFGGQLERLAEDLVAHTSAEVDERHVRSACGLAEVLPGLFPTIGNLPIWVGIRALNI